MEETKISCPPKDEAAAWRSAIWRLFRTGLWVGLITVTTTIVATPSLLPISEGWQKVIVVVGGACLAAWDKISRDMAEIQKQKQSESEEEK